jgi:transposase
MSDLPQGTPEAAGVACAAQSSGKLAARILDAFMLTEGLKHQKRVREACRLALSEALGYPVAKTRPIREVETRMEALEDLKQGRRGPAAEGLRFLAKEFGRDTRTIRRWVEAGYFPGAYKTEGGQWRIPPTCLTESRVPNKLQKRRLKAPNRTLKDRAEKRFVRFNDEFTNLTIILLKAFLDSRREDQPQNLTDLIDELNRQDFNEYLKRFCHIITIPRKTTLQDSINTLVLEYAKIKIQSGLDKNETSLDKAAQQKTLEKKPRRYNSAITIKYLAEYYNVHRSTIHRWIDNDKSFKRKALEIIANSGSEAFHHEVQESYGPISKHQAPGEDDGEIDADQRASEDDFENQFD